MLKETDTNSQINREVLINGK